MKFAPTHFRAAIVGAALAVAGAAHAAPVSFNITSGAFTPGSGYGVDASEVGGTLLDVKFAVGPGGGAASFSMANPGDTFTYSLGTITLAESGIINANETDNLSVLASFTFVDPLLGVSNVTATGTATVGLVGDPAIDLVIAWTPTLVSFGHGGRFVIDLSTTRFNSSGQVAAIDATITLRAVSVPEPATLALTGLALAGLGFTRKRKAA